jgi:hypothetical protein
MKHGAERLAVTYCRFTWRSMHNYIRSAARTVLGCHWQQLPQRCHQAAVGSEALQPNPGWQQRLRQQRQAGAAVASGQQRVAQLQHRQTVPAHKQTE